MMTRTRIVALVAVIGTICFGYWLQLDSPSEKYRVRHPQGYSVCCPQGWSSDTRYYGSAERSADDPRQDGLSLSPDTFAGLPPKLEVIRFSQEPDPAALQAAGWTDGLFQAQPALLLDKEMRHGWARGAIFQRSGQWFQVIERLSVAATAQKDKWWQYLETFRYPDGAIPTAATAPLLPATQPASTKPFEFPAMGQ
jgi:hypothetical protein